MKQRETLSRQINAAIASAARLLRRTYSGPYWPRRNNADGSERHLSFAIAQALHRNGFNVLFEVPLRDSEAIDLIAIHRAHRWRVVAEFKNLYRSGEQARDLAHDIDRMRYWEPVAMPHPRAELRMVLASTWFSATREAWLSETGTTRNLRTKGFVELRTALRNVEATPRCTLGALCPDDKLFPRQWLLWATW